MSWAEHGLECERCDDAAAYVLGALEEHEADAYREHLAGCAICREEVGQLQAVADSLAVAVTRVVTPENLRARLMAVVNGEAELLNAAGYEADVPTPARRGRGWRLLPALAAAVALGVGILIGALAIGGGSTTTTRVVTATVVSPPGYRATAVVRRIGSHLELEVVGMPAPPRGRIYEVWLERGTQAPTPTDALFSVTHSGNGSVGLSSDLNGVSAVLVTNEPLGGSPKPTRTPVIVAHLS